MVSEVEASSLISINTTEIAVCVANMLHEYLIAEKELMLKENAKNVRHQNTRPSYG
jgi:hypothetical protein